MKTQAIFREHVRTHKRRHSRHRLHGSARAAVGTAAAVAAAPAAILGLLFATAPGRCSRDSHAARTRAGERLLIDDRLPTCDATIVCSIVVNAPPAVTFAAIGEANILDPIIRGLFSVRELPRRVSAWVHGEAWSAVPHRMTFGDLLKLDPPPTVLGEQPGVEIVFGSVGRFWQKDYGARPVSAHEFEAFREPGYAKLAISFRVAPHGSGQSLLRYEARTATTDDDARRQFGRYWRLIRPGVELVMRRALGLIREEAEARACWLPEVGL